MKLLRSNLKILSAMLAVVLICAGIAYIASPVKVSAQIQGPCTNNYNGPPVFAFTSTYLSVCLGTTWIPISVAQPVDQTLNVSLTNTQVLGMEAAPVLLLPAPGAGNMYILNAVVENANTGTAYANGGVIGLFYSSTASAANEATGTLAATFLTTPTVTTEGYLGSTITAVPGSSALNGAIYISNLTAPFITGTGTINLQLRYRIQTGL